MVTRSGSCGSNRSRRPDRVLCRWMSMLATALVAIDCAARKRRPFAAGPASGMGSARCSGIVNSYNAMARRATWRRASYPKGPACTRTLRRGDPCGRPCLYVEGSRFKSTRATTRFAPTEEGLCAHDVPPPITPLSRGVEKPWVFAGGKLRRNAAPRRGEACPRPCLHVEGCRFNQHERPQGSPLRGEAVFQPAEYRP